MILAQEVVNAGGQVEVQTNPLYSTENMYKYCRSFKVNRDGVELLRYCTNRKNGCGGRGYIAFSKPVNVIHYENGYKPEHHIDYVPPTVIKSELITIHSCPCLNKTLEKLERKHESQRTIK
jgi:hypothetical protein